ncbi:uncharacterized protein YALI1_F06426g [Yarrowia lipolytica]|uniref:Uncharacterized protein n=1 Tax=Yarrowia lipolytica TaxID=4952 RepID=A0A1D8NLY2_YARLL|nr:hypothetical protein YALI1_F06426g [Yarrowia lipolytica]
MFQVVATTSFLSSPLVPSRGHHVHSVVTYLRAPGPPPLFFHITPKCLYSCQSSSLIPPDNDTDRYACLPALLHRCSSFRESDVPSLTSYRP